MLSQIELQLSKLNNFSKKRETGFTIGSTNSFSASENFYFTPFRAGAFLAYTGVVVKDVSTAVEIARKIDGKVNYIFVDAEKKIPQINYGLDDIGNIEKPIFNLIKKSTLFTYKGNDVTVRGVDALLSVLVPNLTGQIISIVGVSNIGIKVGLSLIERGNQVNLISGNLEWSNKISEFLNSVKLPGSKGKCLAIKMDTNALKNSTILIATSNKKNFIRLENVLAMNEVEPFGQPILVDVGKGCFHEDVLLMSQLKIHRLDVGIQLSSELENLVNLYSNQNLKSEITLTNGTRLVRSGYVGRSGDLIVDNPADPKRVFGLCAGNGNLVPINIQDDEYKFLRNIIRAE